MGDFFPGALTKSMVRVCRYSRDLSVPTVSHQTPLPIPFTSFSKFWTISHKYTNVNTNTNPFPQCLTLI